MQSKQLRALSRVLLGLGALSGIGWAVLSGVSSQACGVVSVLSSLGSAVIGERIERMRQPRVFTETQARALIDSLGVSPKGSIEIGCSTTDTEASDFTEEIR